MKRSPKLVFVHAYEAVYAKLWHILWKDKELYKNVLLLMGGFHQLRVMQRLIYKRYYCRGMQQWCVDAEIIAKGSAEQAFVARHYYRCMRIHKECFYALVQLRIEQITKQNTEIDADLKEKIKILRQDPNKESLNQVLSQDSFTALVSDVLSFKDGSEGNFTMMYLKDVSTMLAMVSAVREGNLRRHIEAEREMLSLTFAFNHQNYARYCSYQHVFLQNMSAENEEAFQQLSERGFGASVSGERFTSIHGDLVTELFNKQTKDTAGPFRAGFSTDISAVNTWVRTIHVHCKLREKFRDMVAIKTSSKHKELSPGRKKMHSRHVAQLKNQLVQYGMDPFSDDKPRSFATGVEIPSNIVDDMMGAAKLGSKQYENFTKECLVIGSKGYFEPIARNKVCTGIEKKKKAPKAVQILKEDRQAFGLMVSKSVNMEEAFNYPITTVPLAIATTECSLRQSDKAHFRNHLISASQSCTDSIPEHCAWFVDGMAAIRSMKPRATFKEFIMSLIHFVTPQKEKPSCIGIINDTYKDKSVKEGTRQERGEQGPRVHVQSVDQRMLQGMRWEEFIHRGDNKEDLIAIISDFLQSPEGRSKLSCPFIVTSKEHTFKIDSFGNRLMFDCNHEEADSRIVLHAILSGQDTVVVSKDTDVLILLVWAYNHFSIANRWYMKYDHEKFADIGLIVNFLGTTVCGILPAFHSLTGCDTTSYFFRVGKVRVFNKLLKSPNNCNLLRSVQREEPLCQNNMDDLKEFVGTVMYNGNKRESYLQTRMRLYQQQKEKSSVSLPPDPDSLLQALKRTQMQTLLWQQCGEITIKQCNPEQYGWKWEDGAKKMVPIW